MKLPKSQRFNLHDFLNSGGLGKKVVKYRNRQVVFSQGDPSSKVFYIQKGRVKLTVVSRNAKEAVVAILGDGDFLGESCLAGQPLRMATATAISACSISGNPQERHDARASRRARLLPNDSSPIFWRAIFASKPIWWISFSIPAKSAWRERFFCSRVTAKKASPKSSFPKISQETLAEMVGTTRSRVSFFMNKFRKLGFIEYNGGLSVHSSLLNVVLID